MQERFAHLYVHFPFCRRKCTYCALHSRAGAREAVRREYVEEIAHRINALGIEPGSLESVYFGGGSPALCPLEPLLKTLAPYIGDKTEFTLELHPLDVNDALLGMLKDGGVNRISMGLQSLDDAILAHMGRNYSLAQAEVAFLRIKRYFDNAGIDLITGYPLEQDASWAALGRLAGWGLTHCSLYSLILEEGTLLAKLVDNGALELADDDSTMNRLSDLSLSLERMGLRRYEISNYAVKGHECRHNMAVWAGENYCGVGEGAYGRLGLQRIYTPPRKSLGEKIPDSVVSLVSPDEDKKERTLFSLRTINGLDARDFPQWRDTLEHFVGKGLLRGTFPRYILTSRGTEVCDSILADIVRCG